jgi:hypothetical protein
MNTDQFTTDLNTLSMLGCNEATAEAFATLYRRIVERTYTAMCMVRNTEALTSGEYTARGQMLKAILQRQVEWAGLEWPEPRR